MLSTTYTVVSTADDGSAGTLRWAIGQVNSDPGSDVDTIAFGLTGSAPFTITPTSPLPAITHPAIVDGASQAGYAVGAPAVAIDGSAAGYSYGLGGLTLAGPNITVQGLDIEHSAGPGLLVNGASNALIQGNLIGTDPTGTTAAGNYGGIAFGYYSTDANITIGGTTAAARNVISGNQGAGIALNYSATPGLTIEGNFIGTDAKGSNPLGNASYAIDLLAGPGAVQVSGNVISANQAGIDVGGYSSSPLTIQDNLIGTDATGTHPLGNAYLGITVESYSPTVAITGNVISANSIGGVVLEGTGATLRGNKIGTDITGTQPLGNRGYGVNVLGYNNLIGDPLGVAGNVIAFNQGPGVFVSGYGDPVLSNSIFGNTAQGIVLSSYGSPQVNPPALAGAADFGSVTAVTGALSGDANATDLVQFFSSPTADPSGYGQGQTYLGSISVTTDGNGHATFQANLPVAVPAGQVISATATTPYNSTSGFSRDATVVAAAPPVAAAGDSYNTDVDTALSMPAPGVLANDIALDGAPSRPRWCRTPPTAA